MVTKNALATVLLFCLGAPAAAAEGLALRGQVVSEERPLEGVRVRLTPMVGNYRLGEEFLGHRPPEAPVSEAETDGDGRFVVVAPVVGFWALRLEAQGFAPLERLLLQVVEDIELEQFELEPAVVREVIVTDPETRPLSARLSIFRTASARRGEGLKSLGRRWRVASTLDPGSPWRMLSTDEQGRTLVDVVSDDRLLIRAVAPGLVAAEALVHGGGKVHLQLQRGLERGLRVVDALGRPLASVMIFDERAEVPLTVTSEDGWAVVVWEGTAPLRIALLDAEGRRGTARIDPPRPEASSAQDADIATVVLDDPTVLTGRVIDRFTREPIANALVWSDDVDNRTYTGAQGDYELLRLGHRPWVVALATGYIRGSTSSDDEPAPTLSLHPTVTLTGRVVDPNGNPVAAVEIRVWRDLARPGASMRYSGWGAGSVNERSAEDGTFRIAGLPARMAFRMSAYREGWAETQIEIDPLEAFARRDGFLLVLQPGRRAVGMVVDEADEPVAGASVTLLPRAEEGSPGRKPEDGRHGRELEGETDEAGGFVITDVAAGAYDLDIIHGDYAPERVLGVDILDLDAGTDLGLFRLAPDALVEGRVVDSDARPVAGAEVRVSNDASLRVTQARRALAHEPVHTMSDERGRFTITGQRKGARLTLVVESADHLPQVVGGLIAPSSEPLEVVLRWPSRVSGRVVDPEGRGVPGARLVLVPEGRAGSGGGYGGPPHYADGRDDGSFEIQRVPPGRITLYSSATGLQDLRKSGLEVPEGGELADIELVMRSGSTIKGVVLDPEGEPVVNATVRFLNPELRRKASRTDGDGRFQIDGLVARAVSLSADHDDFPRVVRELELEPGTNSVDLVFGGGVAVSGQVRDELGQPVAGAWVRLVQAIRTRHSPNTVTKEDGSFLFPGVARGDYFVDAGRRGFAERRREPALPVRDEPIAGVEVELGPGTVLMGQILGLSPTDLARVEIIAYGQLGIHHGEIEADESYRIDHLTAGPWSVRAAIATSGRAVVEILTIDPDEAEATLDLDFSAGFVLTGTVVHEGVPLHGARVGARGLSVGYATETTTDRDGSFRLEGLEEGRYWIGLYDFATGLRHSEEILLEGDDELWIELITDRVSGVVANAFDHEPVEGARVVLEPILEDQEIAARLLQPSGLSDSAGYFSLGDVSQGPYDLVVSRAGYAEYKAPLDLRGPAEGLELELTPTEGVFFELSLADSGPVGWATAVVLEGDRTVARGTWEASDKGHVRMTGVPPGSYEMVIWAPGSATVSWPVHSPGDLGSIVLPRGGTVDVVVPELAGDGTVAILRLVGGDGRPYRSVFGARLEDEFRLLEGRARIPGVPPGTCSFLVEAADGRSWSRNTAVAADQTTQVTLE